MAKRFKLKLSRTMPSFQICRSKSVSDAETPFPAIYRLSRFNPKTMDITYPKLPDPPPSTPRRRPSAGRRCQPRSLEQYLADCSIESPDFALKKEGNKWLARPHPYMLPVSFSDDSFESFSPVIAAQNRINKNEENKKEIGVTSSECTGASGCCFSREAEEEEEETLLCSSRSFSYDSSFDFCYPVDTKKSDKARIGKHKRQVSKNWKTRMAPSPEITSPIRSSVLRRMMSCTTDGGKVKESVAVVKKSNDPYEDFKRSMLEMILEKQMFEAKDLEELLQCFLSLNSRQYHGVIVKAFSEIWEILFCDSPANNRISTRLIA